MKGSSPRLSKFDPLQMRNLLPIANRKSVIQAIAEKGMRQSEGEEVGDERENFASTTRRKNYRRTFVESRTGKTFGTKRSHVCSQEVKNFESVSRLLMRKEENSIGRFQLKLNLHSISC